MHKLNYNRVKCCICKKNIVYRFKNSKRTSIYPTTKGIYKLESYDVICKNCNLIYSNPEPTLKSQSYYYKSKLESKIAKYYASFRFQNFPSWPKNFLPNGE